MLSGVSVFGEDAPEMKAAAVTPAEKNPIGNDDDNTQQVYIEVKYVRLPEKDILEIASKLKVSPNPRVIDSSFIPLILESENLEVIAGGAVLTENGQEATLRFSMEKYFPESYDYDSLTENDDDKDDDDSAKDEKKGDNSDAKPDKPKVKNENSPYTCLMPEVGSPAELGLRMTVTPSVEKGKIRLAMLPVLQSETEPIVYKFGASERKMPSIQTSAHETNGEISDGGMLIYSSNSLNIYNNMDRL